ncbi:MAG: CYTH domain-containing protein [Oscillospiraceae bacterium]|nr:CYTH domain-containing protein [Oscillospiraceae bacterium]
MGKSMKGMEIERKFLLEGFPDLTPESVSEMRQGYLCTDPVVRIRSKAQNGKESYRLCFKGKGTLVRQETELELTPEQFKELEKLLPAPTVRKEKRVYLLQDGHRLECSRVDAGEPSEFFYAEVEFESVEEAAAFLPPDFLGRDVTEEPGYTMAQYWEKKRAAQREEKPLPRIF